MKKKFLSLALVFTMILSMSDIEIIKEIRSNSELFNSIASNPKRFFSSITKKNI